MSTRSAICVYVQKSDRNKQLKSPMVNLPTVTPTDQQPWLGCFCHWDGYPAGVGQDLVNGFNNYEAAKELVLQGSKENVMSPWAGFKSFKPEYTDYACRVLPDHPIKVNFWQFMEFSPVYIYVFGRDKKWRCYDIYERKYVPMPEPNDEPLPEHRTEG